VGRLVLLLGVVLAVTACGGGSTETVTSSITVVETHPPAETTTGPTVTEQPTPPTIDTAHPALASRKFQMPSKNIGCQTGEGVLVCDILSGLNPEPKQKCEVDWTGMEMERLGPAQPRCAGDTAYDQSAPVLEYGTSWSRGGFTCVSQETGVQCRNEENHGFLLSREAWTQF
jgi:uncharacterized protein DUF6636